MLIPDAVVRLKDAERRERWFSSLPVLGGAVRRIRHAGPLVLGWRRCCGGYSLVRRRREEQLREHGEGSQALREVSK
jgi:hypothetical protein